MQSIRAYLHIIDTSLGNITHYLEIDTNRHDVRDHDHRLPVLLPRLGLPAVQQQLLLPGLLGPQGRHVQVREDLVSEAPRCIRRMNECSLSSELRNPSHDMKSDKYVTPVCRFDWAWTIWAWRVVSHWCKLSPGENISYISPLSKLFSRYHNYIPIKYSTYPKFSSRFYK